MAAMLETLELDEGMRVLEVGTGSGYNAALLSARLGQNNVVSIDIDPDLVALARERLASLGYHPLMITGDGTQGYAEGVPYDRVIATHAVEHLPYAWIAQTCPGGMILADVRSLGAPHIGHLARLTVHGDGTATGDFATGSRGNFMPDRNALQQSHYLGRTAYDLRDVTTRSTTLGASALNEDGFVFGLWAHLPDITLRPGPQTYLSTPDGSWAIAPEYPGEVRVAGPRDLWCLVEDLHVEWEVAGRPGTDAYTIIVTPHGQRIAPGPVKG